MQCFLTVSFFSHSCHVFSTPSPWPFYTLCRTAILSGSASSRPSSNASFFPSIFPFHFPVMCAAVAPRALHSCTCTYSCIWWLVGGCLEIFLLLSQAMVGIGIVCVIRGSGLVLVGTLLLSWGSFLDRPVSFLGVSGPIYTWMKWNGYS